MNVEQAASVLAAIAVAFAFLLTHYLWRMYRLDDFQNKMSKLLDDLFDYAADGNISFDDPAYTKMRRQLILFKRGAASLSLFPMIANRLRASLSTGVPITLSAEWSNDLASIENEKTRCYISSLQGKASQLLARHVISRSIWILTAMGIIGVFVFFATIARNCAKYARTTHVRIPSLRSIDLLLRHVFRNTSRILHVSPHDMLENEDEMLLQ
jgi:hypothetical protein